MRKSLSQRTQESPPHPLITQESEIASQTINHNGNDAYELVCSGMLVDSFGQVGTDPGEAWSGSGVSTKDTVLRRRCTIGGGDTNSGDAFDPSVEWEAVTDTDLSGFGTRGC